MTGAPLGTLRVTLRTDGTADFTSQATVGTGNNLTRVKGAGLKSLTKND